MSTQNTGRKDIPPEFDEAFILDAMQGDASGLAAIYTSTCVESTAIFTAAWKTQRMPRI